MVYLQLFYTFFKIGLFGFGGGAAMLSLIQFEIVENHAWITASEFTNMVAVSQITPGPLASTAPPMPAISLQVMFWVPLLLLLLLFSLRLSL